jgi:hypothetical protein
LSQRAVVKRKNREEVHLLERLLHNLDLRRFSFVVPLPRPLMETSHHLHH